MWRSLTALLALLLALSGCNRKHSAAVVLEKEYIAARETTPTPTAAPAAAESPIPDPTPEIELREMAPDEIAVDGVVMKRAVRGTSRDPRAGPDEQWIVKVRTTDGRTIRVPADRSRFDKLRAGDRVQIVYRVGKYTGTVWSADFE